MSATTEVRAGIGERLREVVAGAFSGRDQAAEVAGVSTQTFNRWILGRTDISLDAIEKLSRASGYSREWIAFGSGPKLVQHGGLPANLEARQLALEERVSELASVVATLLSRRAPVVAPLKRGRA